MIETEFKGIGENPQAKRTHDLDHEVYLDPKDGKEHINHGMLEYTVDELKTVHADYENYHKDDVIDPND